MPRFIHVPAQVDKVYEGNAQSSSAVSTITFSSVPFGDESATREIFITFATRSISGYLPTNVTIGGVTATIETVATSLYGVAACAHAVVPTGTTGDVVITMANNVSSCAMAAYRVADRETSGGADSKQTGSVSATTSASWPSMSMSSGGFVLAALSTEGTLSSPDASGLSMAVDANLAPGSMAKVFASTPVQAAASSGNTLTLSWASSRSGAFGAWAFH